MMKKSEGNSNIKKTAVAVFLTAVISGGLAYTATDHYYIHRFKEFKLLSEAQYLINDNFFYKADDKDLLIDAAVGGYVSALDDPYSRYQSVNQTKERSDNHAGLMVGIGITISLREDGYIDVVEVKTGSPAEKAGVKQGDILKAVDGKDVKETGYEESVDAVKNGEENSTVVLTVDRNGGTEKISVKREKIEIITASAEMTGGDIGHISITQFNDKTPEQVKSCFDECIGKGAKGIIFDVRNNGGGLVTAVEDCLDPLLPEGKIAVAVYKDGHEETIVNSDAEETDVPMAVLINGNSASGAELFAASLRDFKGSELIGENSFGKGIMQNTFSLSNGSSVVLTVAEYRTTKSECYHKVGLKPDYEVFPEEGEKDVQLEKAAEVLRKKMK